MNNNGGSRFFDGFLLGLIIGALAVYLFGTKSGKRLVKKFSEEGISGFEDLLENYNSDDESFDTEVQVKEKEEKEPSIIAVKPKKRLFKRFRRVD